MLSEDLIKVLISIAAGGLVGLEREFRESSAGFRTLIFICVGSTLFTILSMKLSVSQDVTRIAANIVTGVGFLGAGVIMRERGKVTGLTTASTIWFVAAIGMGIGAAQYEIVFGSMAVMLIVMLFFPAVERWIDTVIEERTYEISTDLGIEKLKKVETLFRQSGLQVYCHSKVRNEDGMVCSWEARGRTKKHEELVEKLMQDKEIKEFKY